MLARRKCCGGALISHAQQGAFYEAFEAGKARALLARLEFHYRPKHGRWLSLAENELSCRTKQFVKGRRFATIDEVAALDVNRTSLAVTFGKDSSVLAVLRTSGAVAECWWLRRRWGRREARVGRLPLLGA
jgi:hypothetical protein